MAHGEKGFKTQAAVAFDVWEFSISQYIKSTRCFPLYKVNWKQNILSLRNWSEKSMIFVNLWRQKKSFLTKTITKYIPNISYETFESEIKKNILKMSNIKHVIRRINLHQLQSLNII